METESFRERAVAKMKEQLRNRFRSPRSAWLRVVFPYGRTKPFAVAMTAYLLIALVGSLFLVDAISPQADTSALTSRATLSVLSGDVSIQVAGTDAWREADDGMTLQAGARVRTAPESYAILTFFEGSTLRLDPDTDVEIQRVDIVGEFGSVILLKQWVGRTWSRVAKKIDPASSYEIRTPSAYAMVRGTLFEVEVDETATTVVRTTEGLVSVGSEDRDGEVSLPLGQEATVDLGEAPSEPVPIAPPENEIVIEVDSLAVASVSDPTGSSTGQLPGGLAFNQITGSQSTFDDSAQTITIPNPVPGEYSVVLRGIGQGTLNLGLEGQSRGKATFKKNAAYQVTAGSEWLVKINVEIVDGQLTASVSDIEPLRNRAPEKVVKPAKIEKMRDGMVAEEAEEAAE
ncbi:MAG: FecR family protein, partial [Dehalococcoidia bacterium]